MVVLALLGVLVPELAVAGKLSVQGHLANGGSPMDGDHVAVFAFYDAETGGTLLWTEQDTLKVRSYLFSATLGTKTSIPDGVFGGPGVWLETAIDGTALTPRLAYYAQPQLGAGSQAQWSTDGTNAWRDAGNVGLGVSSPVEALHIERGEGSGTASMLMRSYVPGTGPYGLIHFQNTLATGSGIAAEIAAVRPVAVWGQESDLVFSTNPGSPTPTLYERVRITKDGNVGIGTSTPVQNLEVVGSAQIDGDAAFQRPGGSNLTVQTPASDVRLFSQANVPFYIGTNGIAQMVTISPSGNVTIAGSLSVAGTKCREVSDAKYGKLFFNAVESGRAVFTTSGRVKLRHGRAHVELDPKWLAGVTIDGRHPLDIASVVFYGPHGDWYVRPGPAGFEVIESTGADVECFWNVQASQKGYEDNYLDNPDASRTSAR